MTQFKLVIFSVAILALTFFTSCNDDDNTNDNNEQQTTESPSLNNALNELIERFNENGNLSSEDNPVGNIIFDFCFDFVYPIELTYNNNNTVTVNDLDELVALLLENNDSLYINGIIFPFNTEIYNEATNAIEVVTIANEAEFEALIEDCTFNTEEDCDCDDEDDEPVCVAINDPSGETILISFPNECYAECHGFEDNDLIEDCFEDHILTEDFDCFSLNFPIEIITEDNQTISINSYETLANAIYSSYDFELVYPISITLNDDENTIVDIANEEALEDYLDDCFEDEYDCDFTLETLQAYITDCNDYEVELYDLNNDEEIDSYNISFNDQGEMVVNGDPTVTDQGNWSINYTNETFELTISGLTTFTTLNGIWMLACDEDDIMFYNDLYGLELDCEDD